MKCTDCLQHLQAILDGLASEGSDAELESHLSSCADCRAHFAAGQRLREGLAALPAVVVPEYLARQITVRVLLDAGRRRRRIRILAGSALAASVLLVGLWLKKLSTAPLDLVRQPSELVHEKLGTKEELVQIPPLQQTLTEAGQAVVSLSRKAADATMAHGRLFLPAPTLVGTDQPEPLPLPKLEPATQSLRDAGDAMSAGLVPVRQSATRALSLFLGGSSAPPRDGRGS